MNNIRSLFNPAHEDNFSTEETAGLIGLAALAAILISWVPIINILDYPLRLMITTIHELGHGLTAILTGGQFHNFLITVDTSGVALTSGGWRFLVIPAGYLSVAFFAAVLISLGHNHRRSRLALGGIGAAMLFFSLCFGRPGAFSFSAIGNSVLTIFIGVIFGALFLRVAFKAAPGTIIFLLHFVAIKAGLAAFSDIFGLIGITLAGGPHGQFNDAQSMAQLTHIPAPFWAVVWVILAALIIGYAIKKSWFTDREK